MDVNDLRSTVTVVSLLLFLGIVGWSWSRRRRGEFDEAAQLPFAEGAEGAEPAAHPAVQGDARE